MLRLIAALSTYQTIQKRKKWIPNKCHRQKQLAQNCNFSLKIVKKRIRVRSQQPTLYLLP